MRGFAYTRILNVYLKHIENNAFFKNILHRILSFYLYLGARYFLSEKCFPTKFAFTFDPFHERAFETRQAAYIIIYIHVYLSERRDEKSDHDSRCAVRIPDSIRQCSLPRERDIE